jgi:hypothetical protein
MSQCRASRPARARSVGPVIWVVRGNAIVYFFDGRVFVFYIQLADLK